MLHIYVDADACPAKQEVYKVARRYGLRVTLVANSRLGMPQQPGFAMQVVKGSFDAADDWIVEHAQAEDLVVTSDILLAGRCLERGARAIRPNGQPFTEDNIGEATANRELMAWLREAGEVGGGPAPISQRDRSRFLQQLDEMIRAIQRRQALEP